MRFSIVRLPGDGGTVLDGGTTFNGDGGSAFNADGGTKV